MHLLLLQFSGYVRSEVDTGSSLLRRRCKGDNGQVWRNAVFMLQGMYCQRGSAHPRKCPALAACPAGAAVPGFNAGAFITILLVVLVYLAVYLMARYFLQRRSARRKQQQASRNQVTQPDCHCHHLHYDAGALCSTMSIDL